MTNNLVPIFMDEQSTTQSAAEVHFTYVHDPTFRHKRYKMFKFHSSTVLHLEKFGTLTTDTNLLNHNSLLLLLLPAPSNQTLGFKVPLSLRLKSGGVYFTKVLLLVIGALFTFSLAHRRILKFVDFSVLSASSLRGSRSRVSFVNLRRIFARLRVLRLTPLSRYRLRQKASW